MKTYCILGNCQANAIASTLQVCAEFKETYRLHKVTPIHRITAAEHAAFLNEVVPKTDLFMYQPISAGYRGGGFGFDAALARLPATAAVVSYPSIQFYGYHASARPLADMPLEIRDHCRATFGLAGSELFHFSQLILSFLRGLPPEAAEAAFHQGFPGDEAHVRRRCADSLAHLRRAEEAHGIDARLHDAIAAGFRREQLFWSPRHPSGRLLGMIAETALARLGITPTEEERARFIRRDPLTLPRYPLQDFIRRSLGLEFAPITEFRSKTAFMTLPDMVAAYYGVYERLGRAELGRLARAAFPTLPSLNGAAEGEQA